MSDLLNLEKLHKLAIEACCEMKNSHVCIMAMSIAYRERLTPNQEAQLLSYISDDMGFGFDDEMIEKCRDDFTERQAYLYGDESE